MIRRTDTADAFEAALRGRRVADAEVRHLVQQVEALCAVAAQTGPSADFRASLRDRLMTEASTVLEVRPAPARRRTVAFDSPGVRRRMARLSAAAIVAVGGVGLVTSSAQAVPGDMLYGVKRSVETVELALHRSDDGRGEVLLSQSSERLAEAVLLAEAGNDEAVAESLADFRASATEGSAALFDHARAEDDSAAARTVATFAAESSALVAELAGVVDLGDRDLASTADLITSLAEQARSLCSACADITLDDMMVTAAPATTEPSTSSPLPGPLPEVGDGATAPEAATPSNPSVVPSAAAPSASPAAPTDPLAPIVGGLVGDQTQPGLVPGLLGGLLGGLLNPPKS